MFVFDRELKAMEGSHFRLSDITQTLLNMHKENNWYPASHLTLFAFLWILLLKIIDFEQICTEYDEIGYFIGLFKFTGS